MIILNLFMKIMTPGSKPFTVYIIFVHKVMKSYFVNYSVERLLVTDSIFL